MPVPHHEVEDVVHAANVSRNRSAGSSTPTNTLEQGAWLTARLGRSVVTIRPTPRRRGRSGSGVAGPSAVSSSPLALGVTRRGALLEELVVERSERAEHGRGVAGERRA